MSAQQVRIKIINRSHHPLPSYSTAGSAGMDVRACLPHGPVTLSPGDHALIGTGLYMQLPPGYECQIRPRSGLALRHGITILNTPGTIDSDYRGEVGIIVLNAGKEPFVITDGERICQMVIKEYVKAAWEEAGEIDSTGRGQGGFGHTGVD